MPFPAILALASVAASLYGLIKNVANAGTSVSPEDLDGEVTRRAMALAQQTGMPLDGAKAALLDATRAEMEKDHEFSVGSAVADVAGLIPGLGLFKAARAGVKAGEGALAGIKGMGWEGLGGLGPTAKPGAPAAAAAEAKAAAGAPAATPAATSAATSAATRPSPLAPEAPGPATPGSQQDFSSRIDQMLQDAQGGLPGMPKQFEAAPAAPAAPKRRPGVRIPKPAEAASAAPAAPAAGGLLDFDAVDRAGRLLQDAQGMPGLPYGRPSPLAPVKAPAPRDVARISPGLADTLLEGAQATGGRAEAQALVDVLTRDMPMGATLDDYIQDAAQHGIPRVGVQPLATQPQSPKDILAAFKAAPL